MYGWAYGAETKSEVAPVLISSSGIQELSSPLQSPSQPKTPRLKFKSPGPTCMCGDELTEKNIIEQQRQRASEQK